MLRWLDPRGNNALSIMASEADDIMREGVFVTALKQGRTEAESATLAKKALLDYGALTAPERAFFSKAMLFYTFQRMMTFDTVTAFARNPSSVRRIVQGQRGLHEAMGSWDAERDYQKGRLWNMLGEDAAHLGPSNPVTDSMAFMMGIADWLTTMRPGDPRSTADMAKEGALDFFFSPEADLVQAIKENRPRGMQHGKVPPRWAAGMIAMDERKPGTWAAMRKFYHIEAVPDGQGSATAPTFNGLQFRFADKDGWNRWVGTQYGLVRISVARTLRDYVQGYFMVNGTKPPGFDLKHLDASNPILHGFAVDTPASLPTLQKSRLEQLRAIEYELRDLK